MSRTSRRITYVLFILILNGVVQTEAAKLPKVGQFFSKVGDKIVQTATTIKEYLIELFYRFRALFMGHSESTHNSMLSKGCGFAADQQPAFYNKNPMIESKIKGGEDAIWHTW